LVEVFQELLIGRDTVAGLEDLGRLFEQQRSHLPFGQAAAEIKERAVFVARSAMAIGAAALEKALQKGGVDRIGREGQGAQEVGFALTQDEGREALELCLTHNIGKIAGSGHNASENENAGGKRKRFRRG
jgi:hypothetical protein